MEGEKRKNQTTADNRWEIDGEEIGKMTLIRLGKAEMNNGVIMFVKIGKEIEK